jgi:hypothetical protein
MKEARLKGVKGELQALISCCEIEAINNKRN